ncbi:SDR family NAD(P)-dependent oxidoreductase [Pseudomonas sp. O230]|uniref:SDR family NAD(P)-dependent oxidoreductase n=1 Tax=Pseudomonas sp. O230 TaxID=3159450 RepID=UPI00387AC0CF
MSEVNMSVLEKFSLVGKVALVTGAAQGLGLAIAKALAEAGAQVALTDINIDLVNKSATAVSKESGRETLALKLDVTDRKGVEDAMQLCVAKFGKLDICVANAGIAETNLPVRDISEYADDQWDRVISVNLNGVYNTNMAAAKLMKANGSGKIINIASIMGLAADPAWGTIGYTASKGGVVQLTRQFAFMLAKHGIQVNAIAPGFINTGMSEAEMPDNPDPEIQALQKQVLTRTPMGRFGEPDEIQGIALFLASEASSFCTGAIYPVDGGWLCA